MAMATIMAPANRTSQLAIITLRRNQRHTSLGNETRQSAGHARHITQEPRTRFACKFDKNQRNQGLSLQPEGPVKT
eukprot:590644-Amphidinium_carterae.1